jgi:hypothetical protein
MALAFDIAPTTKSAKLDASRKGQLEFTVTNALKRDVRARVRVVPEGQTKVEWLKLDATEKDLKADGTAKFTVSIAAPKEAAAGDYAFHIVVASVAKPDDEFANGPPVSFSVPQPPPEGKKPFPWWILIVVGAVILVGGGVTWLLVPKGAKVAAGTPCGPGKATCASNQKCVSVGTGSYCLIAPKQACDSDLKCSSQWCDTRTTPNVCSRDDGRCDNNNECRAPQFVCTAGACHKVDAQACATPDECASGYCAGGKCGPKPSNCIVPCQPGFVGCPPAIPCRPRVKIGGILLQDPRVLELQLKQLTPGGPVPAPPPPAPR